MFNAYTKYFNQETKRTGSLFERPFKRIKIGSEAHLKYLVYYIHHNPVHHGFCNNMLEYPWSSYLTILSPKQTRLKRADVLKWYSQINEFRKYHREKSVENFSKLHLDLPLVSSASKGFAVTFESNPNFSESKTNNLSESKT